MTKPWRRWAPPIVSLVALSGLGACGGEGEDGGPAAPTTTSPAPAARIDPNARGVLTKPINDARRTAEDAEQRQHEQEQQTESDPSE